MENFNEQDLMQVDRFLRKVCQKFTSTEEPSTITDIHIRTSPDSGDILAFDDDDNEITRCVVENWIGYKHEDFYDKATLILRDRLSKFVPEVDNLCLLKPYSFVLENEEGDHVAELYVADDDINILGGDIMQDWDKDLDQFLDNLMKR